MIQKVQIFPRREDVPSQAKIQDALPQQQGDVWAYYPWHHAAVHLPDENEYFALRTARNRNIITKEEQQAYRQVNIGIIGLSVGSQILSTLVMTGGPKNLKIADFDTIEISNLNRISATVLDLGKKKIHVTAQRLWELDPFLNIEMFEDGIQKENIESFILGEPALNILIDEMDNLSYKILVREFCRQHGIPVLMATDNGESILLDVERFDLEPDRPIFHGLLGDMKPEDLEHITKEQWFEIAKKIIQPQYMSKRMQSSLSEIGKTLQGIPQLGSSATVAGSAVSFAVRKIANHQTMDSGRYAIDLEYILSQPRA